MDDPWRTLRVWVAAVAAAVVSAAAWCTARAEEPPRPNVVVVFCDDLGYGDLGCYGATDVPTPQLDRMAAQGLRFTDFYAAASVCTPSRAGLITGRHPIRVGLPGVLHPHEAGGLPQAETTIAEILRDVGYVAGCFGKWHLGHRPEFLPFRHGFDESLVIPYSHDMYRGAPWAKPAWTAAWPDFVPLLEGAAEVGRLRGPEDFRGLTERFTDAACEFIARHAGEPFFLYLPQPMPHQEVESSAEWRGRSRRGAYGDAVAELDAAVGRVLAVLAEHGLERRTLVVFTSDNGPADVYQKGIAPGGSAAPLSGRKNTCLEGGMRVPCIMRWPGTIPAGSVCKEVATAMDLLPTCAALAGARLPNAPLDGRDILPLLERPGAAASPHAALPYYRGERLEAIRAGRWKLWLERRERGKDGTPTVQAARLYDLGADVAERHDLAAAHPEIVTQLQAEACKRQILR